jgi:hypothetical protein
MAVDPSSRELYLSVNALIKILTWQHHVLDMDQIKKKKNGLFIHHLWCSFSWSRH